MIRFSIITVCLNAGNCIRETIQSVLDQTTSDFEYIIKDGQSGDETIAIAQSFSEAFAERGIAYRIISGKDTGIYDAMNQAIRETQGEWLLFMNAGDRIAGNAVLAQVAQNPVLQEADIVYGDTIQKKGELFRYAKPHDLEWFRYGLPFCHQSVFTRRELFEQNDYSLKYKICSAFHYYLQRYHEGKRFVYVPEAFSVYDVVGVSSNWKLNYQDKIQILEDMPVRDEEAIRQHKQTLARINEKHIFRDFLRQIIPKGFREKKQLWELRKAGWKTEEEFFGMKKDDT